MPPSKPTYIPVQGSKYANNVIRKVTPSGEEEISFFCEYCMKTFMSLQGLMYHRPYHTGEWKYVCDQERCGQGYMKSRDFNAHMKKKHGIDSQLSKHIP